jgi:Icc-related predicted phosphoesterase
MLATFIPSMAFSFLRRENLQGELAEASSRMRFPFVYSADQHGNESQYRQLVQAAIATGARAIVVGGDLAPKHQERDFIGVQRAFLDARLPEIFSGYLEAVPSGKVFVMLGNDDAKSNDDVLSKHADILTPIHQKRIALTGDLDIVGYAVVPVTPFGVKDWEKFDLSTVRDAEKKAYQKLARSWCLDGLLSHGNRWHEIRLNPQDAGGNSIERDLSSPLFTEKPGSTVYVFHAPPFNTNLDRLHGGEPVGSIAIRRFIEDHQPLLTLHGHIHETVDASGSHTNVIGQTVSMSPGNMPEDKHAKAILVDAYNPHSATRITLNF